MFQVFKKYNCNEFVLNTTLIVVIDFIKVLQSESK